MIGRTLGHYRIESKLGEGGMGVVYKARDTHLDRPVAIKVLPPERVADPARKRRFVQEARAASALNHPNILHIYDIDATDGVDFIAMEYVTGKTLDQLIAGKKFALRDAMRYAVQIADALAVTHAAGVVHRDIKPSNIMVGEGGSVKILDFGLAKLVEPTEGDASVETHTVPPQTEEGVVVGTVAYMSPEQAEGKKLDGRSDIFSFGSVFYEMVTGRRPFVGSSRVSTLSRILTGEPRSPSEHVPAISPELDKIILRCLRKDPARRYQTMADLKVALEDVERESGSGAQAPGVRALSRRAWTWAASVLVLAVAAYFGWRAWQPARPAEPLRAVAITTFPGVVSYPSLSPNGDQVAFMWTGRQDNPDIYVQMIGSAGSPLQLTADAKSDYNPVWSPDGRWIAFLRAERPPPSSGPAGKAELWLIPPLAGPERKLTEIQSRIVGTSAFLAWCPDSTCLVSTDSPGEGKPDGLFVISRETGEKRQLTSPQAPALGDCNPAFSPDGRWLVYRHVPAAAAGELYLLALHADLTVGGEPRRLTSAALDAAYPAWLPGGKEILFSARRSLWRLMVSGQSPPARLPFVGEDGEMPVVSGSQPGRPPRLVYLRAFVDRNIWRIETRAPGAPALSPPLVAISSTKADVVGDFSPDGRRVAFGSARSGERDIWLAYPDGSEAMQLTAMGAVQTAAPRWSPDGTLIAFQTNLNAQFDVYVIPTAGGKPRRVTDDPAADQVPSFSRDGQWIYFSSNRTGDYQVWRVGSRGGTPVQVTTDGGFLAMEGTDGAYLYYTQEPAGPSALWRIPTAGGQPVKLLEGVINSDFVVLDKGIYYVDQPAGGARLQYFRFATGRSTTVALGLGNVLPLLAASPDGRTILYTRQDSLVRDLMLVEDFR